jgi:hypothetical protein
MEIQDNQWRLAAPRTSQGARPPATAFDKTKHRRNLHRATVAGTLSETVLARPPQHAPANGFLIRINPGYIGDPGLPM